MTEGGLALVGAMPTTGRDADRAVAAGCAAACVAASSTTVDVLDAVRARDLEPVVVLAHLADPVCWLRLDAPERFAAEAARSAEALGGGCRHWITMLDPNAFAVQAFVTGRVRGGHPPATGHLLRALDHLLAGHVLAADAVRAAQPGATVALGLAPTSVYETSELLVDVLLARLRGAARADIGAHLRARRQRAVAERALPAGRRAQLAGRARRRAAASVIPLDQALPRAISAVYESPTQSSLDRIAVGVVAGVVRTAAYWGPPDPDDDRVSAALRPGAAPPRRAWAQAP